MRFHRWQVGSAAFVVGLIGCTTTPQQQVWVNKASDVTAKAADQTGKALKIASDRASKAMVRMQHYLTEKDTLKTFYDAGEHSETAVLDVLHRSGVNSKPAAGGGHGTAGTGSAPAGTSPGSKSAPPPMNAALPEKYTGGLQWPLEAGIVSSEYGERWGKMHKGIDIAADIGEPVYAIAAGEVIYAGNGMRGYGNVVVVRHDRMRTSLYAHNSELKVKQGDQVTQGSLVALLGSTGHSTGPHVHFEIRDGDTPVNPRSILPASKLAQALGVPELLTPPEPDSSSVSRVAQVGR
jgi:murein DD-endopeptidase MepM/ murein hydrolase activator NlpD